jgi:hypothetical protein
MRTDDRPRTGFAIAFTTVVLLTAAATGCASEPKPRPTLLDPSSPAAPESPPLAAVALAPSADRSPPADNPTSQDNAKASEGGKAGKQQGTIYTCPMHPEVTSDKPGRCPKCGMKLVPKEPDEGKK